MSKTTQVSVTRYSRGVKLVVQHLVGEDNAHALNAIVDVAAQAAFDDTREDRGVDKHSFVLPWAGPESVNAGAPVAFFPCLFPPFQQLFLYGNAVAFNYASLEDPQYRCTLAEISLSIDQKGEPYAVVGPHSVSVPGTLTAADMNRYDMVLRLMQRVPSRIASPVAPFGPTSAATEVLRFDIDGVDAFGTGAPDSALSRTNPLVVADLNVPLDPFAVYFWELSCPGLFSAAGVGVLDKWTATVGGAPAAGDVYTLNIGGILYTYVVQAADTLALVADGVTAAVVAAGGNADYNVTHVPGSADVVIESKVPWAFVAVTVNVPAVGTWAVVNTTVGVRATVEQLALVDFHLNLTTLSPLIARDQFVTDDVFTPQPIQNIPAHQGLQTGYPIPMTAPAANAIITGTDVQAAMHGADLALRQRAASGYGVGYGAMANDMQASAVAPRSLLARDSHYSTIVVPLWTGQYRESVRVADLPDAGFPYAFYPWAAAPATQVPEHRVVVPVPEGFVLHHAFAVWNGYSPRATTYGRTVDGVWPNSGSYVQEVGIRLQTGMRGDSYLSQQVAYLQWTASAAVAPVYTDYLVDDFLTETTFAFVPAFRLLQIPLVHPAGAPWQIHSWRNSGLPFFMGKANTMTRARTNVGTMPTDFGPGAAVPPVTNGAENVLEIRWKKNLGALAGMTANDVIVGAGGESVVLIGKQTLAG